MFAAEPTVLKDDYAKWMLEDPRVNFAISTGSGAAGISHLGIQAEDEAELAEVYDRLARAERPFVEAKDDHLLLRAIRQAMDRRPARRAVGDVLHLRRRDRLRAKGALSRLGEASGGLSTCGCAPAALTQPEAEPEPAEACCAPSCCTA